MFSMGSKSCSPIALVPFTHAPMRSHIRNFHVQKPILQNEPVNIGGEEADEFEVQDVEVSDVKEKQYVKKKFLKNKSLDELKNMIFAVVSIGGKQYKVVEGDELTVDRIPVDIGTRITFKKVLLVGGKSFTAIGRPIVANASVIATVEQQTRTAPVIVFKMKRRKGYRRWNTFQGLISTIRIEEVKYEVDNVEVVREERVVAVE
jgi:large subunit ribosomal protein L21